MKFGKAKILLLIAILLFSTENIFGQSPGSRPNVVVLIADDVGVDDIGCYGNSIVDTPNIDYLASNGMKFNNAYLTTSSCSPSRISIITGRYPHNTGAAELHTEPEIAFESIASKLKENGYYTAQAGKWHMGSLLKQDFDQIIEDRHKNGAGGEKMWIESLRNRDKDKPFFLWFAAYDAHRPWEANKFSNTHKPNKINVPPTLVEDDSTRIDLAKYYDEIKRWDFYVGKVVKELRRQGILENTIIIVMSDNGRPFPRDKTRMYDSGLKTPFIIHWPRNIKRGAISSSLISAVDIAPTILDLCNAEIPKTFQGRSFKKLINHPDEAFRNYVFAEHNWHDHEAFERMVRTKDYLYIKNFRPALPNQGPADAINSPSFRSLLKAKEQGIITETQFDVFLVPRPQEELYRVDNDNDALQTKNLIKKENHSDVRNRLNKILKGWMSETCDNVPDRLTKDWYTRDTGKRIEENFQVRGEMPGEKNNADGCNSKGAF